MDRNLYAYADSTNTVFANEGSNQPNQPPAHEKLTKHFPEASLATYIAVDPLVRQIWSGDARRVLLWVLLGVAAVLGWLYLTRVWKVTRLDQVAISGVAFITYVAAIGGPFVTIDGYSTAMGAIAAILLTAFIVFLPAPVKP